MEAHELLRSQSEVISEQLASVKTELQITKESLRESQISVARIQGALEPAIVKDVLVTPEKVAPSRQPVSTTTKPKAPVIENLVTKTFNPLPTINRKPPAPQQLSPEPVLRSKQAVPRTVGIQWPDEAEIHKRQLIATAKKPAVFSRMVATDDLAEEELLKQLRE